MRPAPPILLALALVAGCGLYVPLDEHLARVDADLDGVPAAEDCDDDDPLADVARSWFLDADDDGVGGDETVVACNPPARHVLAGGDCDDTDPAWSTESDWFADADGDGFGGGPAVAACGPPADHVALDGDCDDADPRVHPDAVELCNLLDDDCNERVDDDAVPTTWYVDADADGFGDDDTAELTCDPPPYGVLQGGDCDEGAPEVNPGAIEVCNSIDDDCDTLIDGDDPSTVDLGVWYVDADADGWGNGNEPAVTACEGPDGYVPATGDCDDLLPARNPGHDEICDGIDNDCDLAVDDADPDRIGDIYFLDLDGDGWGDAGNPVEACIPPAGALVDDTDCDDTDATIHPGRTYEVVVATPGECTDGKDNDCDTEIDAADADCGDVDGDGHVDGIDPIYPLDCHPGGGVECLCARADLLLQAAWAAYDAIHVVRGERCVFDLCGPAPVSSLSDDDTDPLGLIDEGSWCWDFTGEPADTYVFRWVSARSESDPALPVNPNSCDDWYKIDLSDACGVLDDAFCTTTTDGLVPDHVDDCDTGTVDALEVTWDGSTL